MDDFKTLLYIIFGVIYVISLVMKNRKKQQSQQGSASDASGQSPEKQVSFEDLLKEFTQGQQEEPILQEESITESIEYQEPVKEQVSWAGSDEEASSVYEKSIKAAKDLPKTNMKEQGHSHYLKRFGEYEEEEENTFLSDLREDLSEAEGLKKAVIYKEILSRKHF